MFEQVSLGNLLTIVTVVLGLILQYIALIKTFSERLTSVETEQRIKHDRLDKDIDGLSAKVDSNMIALNKDVSALNKDVTHILTKCKELHQH